MVYLRTHRAYQPAPLFLLAYKQLSNIFTIKTIAAIIGLAICLAFIEVPAVRTDKLLIATWRFFLGAGIGMSIRGGAVLDGTRSARALHQPKDHTHRRRSDHVFQRAHPSA